MNPLRKSSLTLICALISPAILAADDIPAPSGEWKSNVELGFVSTSGNTETETLNVKAGTATDREKWRHKLNATVLRASETQQMTAEKYTLSGKSDYKLQDPTYLFVTVNYEDDRFSGFEYQASEAVGYGWRVIENKAHKLDLEAGPGARQSKPNGGTTENEGLMRVAANYDWEVSKTSAFAEAFSVEAGEESTITKSETSLTSQVSDSLSMKLTLLIKHSSKVPAGTDKTDRETSATLVYSF